MTTLERCLAFVFRPDIEGGYGFDPADPGGETKYGISARAYPAIDIRHLTQTEAAQIYERDYWRVIHGPRYEGPLALVMLDTAIHSGTYRAIAFLQSALELGSVDGVIGPVTIGALSVADHRRTAEAILAERFYFLSTLPGWRRYGHGWTRRILELHKAALQWE